MNERRSADRRASPAVVEFAIQECARLRTLNAELVAALRAFLEAQDSPAPRDLLTLAAIQASVALAKAEQK